MDKKGDLEMKYVVLFALGLVVLVVIILIFYSGASDFAAKIRNTLADIWSAKPTNLFEGVKEP